MSLGDITDLLRDEQALLKAVGRAADVIAVPEPGRAIALAALVQQGDRRPIVVVAPSDSDAEGLQRDLVALLGPGESVLFPSWETLPFEGLSPAIETMGRRMKILWSLSSVTPPAVVVVPIRAAVQKLTPESGAAPIIIGLGDAIDLEEVVSFFVASGYRRDTQVYHRGDLAVRGSILDIYPSTTDAPIRIDLWGDEVDRLSEFSLSDQRSTSPRSEVEIFPCREFLPGPGSKAILNSLVSTDPWGREQWERLVQGDVFDGMESWLPWLISDEQVLFDRLHSDALVVVVEPKRCRDRSARLLAEEDDLTRSLSRTWNIGDDRDFPGLHVDFDRIFAATKAPLLSITAVPESPDVPTLSVSGWDTLAGATADPVATVRIFLSEGYAVVVAADGKGSAVRLESLFREHGLNMVLTDIDDPTLLSPGGKIVVSDLEVGVVLSDHRVALVTETELTGRRRSHRQRRTPKHDAQGFFDDLRSGAYVVHRQHGVARYKGIVNRSIGGIDRDYLLLEYRGGDKLYVATEQINNIRHYTGGDTPTLSRMGGSDWQKTKSRVRSAVQEIAQELVVLYQKRVTTDGHAYAQDSPWQIELENAFPFQETPDQIVAVEAVKADMESPTPMDRLVCGDVGFGKTEVALRAIFKAIQDGKQSALLVPTTLLAQQHFQTFRDRFSPYPIRVEVLSRFLTSGHLKEVLSDVASGQVDLVIGTHRLLSSDVQFRDLGLLVVDEEQRFGVKHKERIKELRSEVDVLTLTATPIPRTLEMALTGIRDLTILNTPPADRQPILTYVGEYDERAVVEAVRRELLREGQLFFVHNRVADIEDVADRLRDLVPEARFAVAHGQMDEGTLEQVVIDFWEGAFDVLVCTTIIESGIDMPTVNTLVVDQAELLGLGQLHQLRGRVGRSGSRAYAYLFTPRDCVLSEDAYERLKTIGESTELGSGFKIAMRDLEIRGAGNLLGTGQSGHIAAVGYDLYCQLVTEAVADLKGELVEEHVPEINIEMPVAAHLPIDYVQREESRLEAYRKLSSITSETALDDVRNEWMDRFGPLPREAEMLIAVGRLRLECGRMGIEDLVVTRGLGFGGPKWVAKISPVRMKISKTLRLDRLYKGSVYKEEASQLVLALTSKDEAPVLILEALGDLFPSEDALSFVS